MDIRNERDARTWAAYWVAASGTIRHGILATTISGLTGALAIMAGSPYRYSFAQREDLREAIAYLTRFEGDK